jgi:hypothetical protein
MTISTAPISSISRKPKARYWFSPAQIGVDVESVMRL